MIETILQCTHEQMRLISGFRSSICFDMDLNNTENTANSGNSSTISPQPSTRSRTNHSSINTSITTDTRRSVRLSAKSPKKPSLSSDKSNVHRTISGGVASHSPKLNTRKRTSGGINGRGTSASSISYSTIPLSDDDDTQNDDNNNNTCQNLLPSDQSDDDEMLINNNVLLKKPSTGLATRAEVLSYFVILDKGFKCKLCDKVYQSYKHSDANLRKHLASMSHQLPNMLFTSQKNDGSKVQATTISSERKRELHAAAVECILRDGLPFGVFRSPGMVQFMQTVLPGYVGPHRKTVRRQIAAIYSAYTNKLRSILCKIEFLALTCDLWRSPKRVHFISLTGHIFTNTYDTIPIVLGCRRIVGRHLATNIERYITFELNRLNIKPEQIISITTDNGSEMKKATSTLKFGNRVSCMAHNLNLVVKHGLCLWKEPNPNDFPLDLDFHGDEWEDIDDDNDDDASEDDENLIEIATDLISEEDGEDGDKDDESSGDDTDLNKTASDEFESDTDADLNFSTLKIQDNKSSDIDHQELLLSIFNLMNKTRTGIKFIRNHSILNEYVMKHIKSKKDGNNGALVLDMIIRWNSSYLLLDRLTTHKDIIKNVFSFPNNFHSLTEKQKKQLYELTLKPNEWELLERLQLVLKPFQESTIALSGRHYPTMASSFIIWRLITNYLNRATDDPVTLAMKDSLRYRFGIYLNNKLPAGQLEIMKVAAFLDPLTYKRMMDDDRKSARKIIFRKLQNSTVNTIIPVTHSSQLNKIPSDPLDRLAMICGETEAFPTSTNTKRPKTVDEEISSYVEATRSATSFKEFWIANETSLPRLSRLVRQTHIIPATSVASESLFSVASFLNRKQRSSLSSRTLRYLLVLKDRHLLDNLNYILEQH